jgi:3-oxoacyl-[acyl-carrier-protein] synthase-3
MSAAETPESIGRQVHISGAAIAGIVSCVPAQIIGNTQFIEKFGESAVGDVTKMIGVESRRWTSANVTTRDLCLTAGQKLLSGLKWAPESVDALIFVSQTPDYRLPATACALQSDLNLSKALIAFDVNLGCSGYPYALLLGMSLIKSGAAKRVLLAVGDTISKVVDNEDRATALLFGDAGTMTALEQSDHSDAFFVMGTDGKGAENLIVPTGAFRDYSKSGDPRLENKNPSCLFMDGGEIFNFTLRSIPALAKEIFEFSKILIDGHDAFLFHQANLFMLKHLAKKIKIPLEKMPINIEEYGNTSCASIPLLMTTRLRERLLNEVLRVSMFGFGVGYSWGASSLPIGPLKYVEAIEL